MDLQSANINSKLPAEILSLIFKNVHRDLLCSESFESFRSAKAIPDDGSDLSDSTDSEDESEAEDTGNDTDSSSSGVPASETCDIDIDNLRAAVVDQSFFPYGLASVCQHWEGVLSSTPEFWTTVVIFLDRECTPLTKVQEYFQWSRDLQVDVFMTRRPDSLLSPEVSSLLEPEIVRQRMETLMPHLHRCRTLHIDVTMNTSLPILPTHLPDDARLLRHLSFRSDIALTVWDADDRKHAFSLDASAFGEPEGKALSKFTPRLKTLYIDGRNVQFASRRPSSWLLHQKDLKQLTIADYSVMIMSAGTCESQNKFDLHTCDACALSLDSVFDAIDSAPKLKTLTLQNLSFTPGEQVLTQGEIFAEDDSPMPGLAAVSDLTRLDHLAFIEMEPKAINQILHRCILDGLEYVSFVHCPQLHKSEIPDFYSPNLRLVALDHDVDLAAFVKAWDGECLSISSCNNFNDHFLEFLGSVDDNSEDEEDEDNHLIRHFQCPEMVALMVHFDHSPPYTVQGLKKMIESRGRDIDYSTNEWKNAYGYGPALFRLRVTGEVPELSQADEKWFRDHVIDFEWGSNLVI